MEGSKNYMIPTEPQMASHYPQKVVIVWVRDPWNSKAIATKETWEPKTFP